MDVFVYIAKVSSVLSLFYLVYVILLKRDTYHNFKRGYLIFGLMLSITLPTVTNTTYISVEAKENSSLTENTFINLNASNPSLSNITAATDLAIDWVHITVYIYLAVTAILILVLIFKYLNVIKSLKKMNFFTDNGLKYCTIDQLKSSFSFFKYIVISTADYNSKNREMIIEHEKIHAKHFHSLDVLFVNFFAAVFWLNPNSLVVSKRD